MTWRHSSGSDTSSSSTCRQPPKLGSYGVEYFLREPSPPVNEVIYRAASPQPGRYKSESLNRINSYQSEASYKISRFNEITKSAGNVREVCTTGGGFCNTGKLNEHIKRVHTRMHGCLSCGHRFTNVTKAELEKAKAQHNLTCKKQKNGCRDIYTPDDFAPEWMTEDQDSEYERLVFPRGHSKDSPQEVFERIYRALWPDTPKEKVPHHLHGSGPFVSRYKLETILNGVCSSPRKPATQTGQTESYETRRIAELERENAVLKEQFAMLMSASAQEYGFDSRISPHSPMATNQLTRPVQARRADAPRFVPTHTAHHAVQGHSMGRDYTLSLSKAPEITNFSINSGPMSNGDDSGLGSSESDSCNPAHEGMQTHDFSNELFMYGEFDHETTLSFLGPAGLEADDRPHYENYLMELDLQS
ncbi:uncharacterized protein B0I36DRAFT_357834 [Microdochium trichocladiopsis]|uniref:Uncharacterized protein n=1 Tax=Microdochium trichocladiopsis TaxID=1682393 RepID=A0A9P8YHD8_9PEZI|nr:uncharacterized protein B0I36DRAFT_357834 [Microdochium trichocladiopsis]KAH7040551.1 hypothetical protein B0I36DRAFT_357834 [Microdochium trichocladiopsis]